MSVRYSDIRFRPIGNEWSGELTTHRRRSQFRTPWGRTIALLERELSHLEARNVVFQIAVDERDLRLDGKPRAQARASHPGVILAFDSKYGPLKYAVDTYDSWDDNVRAIALAMEALRAVDRYGVTKRGEQYTGWKAIPQTTSGDPGTLINTRDDAARVILDFTSDLYGLEDILDNGSAGTGAHLRDAIRAAQRRTHPDVGGDPDDFRRVMRAKELLA